MLINYVADHVGHCDGKREQTDLPFPKKSILPRICVPKSLWSFKNVMHN